MPKNTYQPGPWTRAVVAASDFSSEFWPTGWMVYACIGLGVFDVSILGYVVHGVFFR